MKKVLCIAVLAVLLLAAGCGNQAELKARTRPAAYTDDLGRQVDITEVPQTIVSVSPACTEILFALGLGEKVAGVTTYCNYPDEATSKPKIGTFTTPNLESIIALKPDLVLATGGVQRDILDRMEELGLTVYAVNAATFDATIEDIRDIGEITGTSDRAEVIAGDMEDRAAVVASEVAKSEAVGDARPKVFYEIFYESNVWTAGSGTIISDLIAKAGGLNIADVQSGDYYEFSVERLITENPQVYLVGSGSMSNPGDIGTRSGWDRMDAIKNGKLSIISDDLVYRTGPRLIEGLELIYKAIYR